MNLDELKKSMSTLDDVLAQKSKEPIKLNIETCNSAQSRIAKQYRRDIRICAVLAAVFIVLGVSGTGDNDSFPAALKVFLGIYLAVAAVIYTFLYRFTKKIQVATSTPMQTMKQAASLRLYTLIAEIFHIIILAVFYTIFLSNLWAVRQYTFGIVAVALFISLVIAAVMLPKKIKYYRELTATD